MHEEVKYGEAVDFSLKEVVETSPERP